jgi:Protein of unknown function (DUF2924)
MLYDEEQQVDKYVSREPTPDRESRAHAHLASGPPKPEGLDGGAGSIRTAGAGRSIGSGEFLPVSFSPSRSTARLKRTGEGLASDSDQSDVYVCPKKERAGMKRDPSESGTKNLADELAELRGLDPTTLRRRWRALYRTEAPVRIGQALLLQAVACRLQERVLGGLKPSTRRLLGRTAEDSLHRQTLSEAPATKVTPGSVLIREWHTHTLIERLR